MDVDAGDRLELAGFDDEHRNGRVEPCEQRLELAMSD
jgi:hypothetical protein